MEEWKQRKAQARSKKRGMPALLGRVEAKKGAGKKQEKRVACAFWKSGSKERRRQCASEERCLRYWKERKLRKAQARSKKREMPALLERAEAKKGAGKKQEKRDACVFGQQGGVCEEIHYLALTFTLIVIE